MMHMSVTQVILRGDGNALQERERLGEVAEAELPHQGLADPLPAHSGRAASV
jgi:hypothetical protein